MRPWSKPLIPDFDRYSYAGASRQPESEARRRYGGLVAESGRAYCEMIFPWLDKRKAATVDFERITTPVLAIGAEYDNAVNPKIARDTAEKFSNGTYVEIADSDHMLFFGAALAPAMSAIDKWVADEKIFD